MYTQAVITHNLVALWSMEAAWSVHMKQTHSLGQNQGSVHLNFPRSLHEVERTSKWQWDFRGEVLREVSKSVKKCKKSLKVEWNAALEQR